MPDRSDPEYYAMLAQGADYLAEEASNPAERETHLKSARIYRSRASATDERMTSSTVH